MSVSYPERQSRVSTFAECEEPMQNIVLEITNDQLQISFALSVALSIISPVAYSSNSTVKGNYSTACNFYLLLPLYYA